MVKLKQKYVYETISSTQVLLALNTTKRVQQGEHSIQFSFLNLFIKYF